MKRLLLTASTLLATIALGAQTPWWQDIQVTSIGAQTQRTEVIYHPTKEDALTKGFRSSVNYVDLNGTWDFKYFDDYSAIPAESFTDGEQMDAFTAKLKWDSIKVPGNWEAQGWGIPIYTNHGYDFCPRNPEPPKLPDVFPAGIYHRKFTLPDAWKDRQVYLNLCGTKSGTYVYVNGCLVGYHEDSKDLARYNISGVVRDGENELTLLMMRYSTGSYLECQDFWRISGIERDVYLSSENNDTGFDFSVISTLDENLENGLFKLRMKSDAPTEVYYELIDKDGTVLSDAVFEFNGRMATTTDTIPSPRKWTAETPELYTLLLRVNGEFTRFHVGFRRFELKDVPGSDGRPVKVYLVNGQPVKFKGVNLHEHNPFTGHYVDRALLLKDLTLMKEANVNAIRTCHYPQGREFYELCDSVGIYVWDECNIESHGMYYGERSLAKKPEWQTKHIDRTLNCYRRTANYPCVSMLSLGNEAGNGVNFQETYKLLKALEKNGMNRAVTYERAEDAWNSDWRCPMYVDANWFRWQGQNYSKRPVIPVEYAHAMGNSTGAFDLMWNEIYAYVNNQGAFIWDWVDQGLYDKERGWTYGGDYGVDAPSDGNFNLNGIVDPDRRPHPGYFAVKQVHQDIAVSEVEPLKGRFSVFNRFYFKSLEGYTLRYRVERSGKVVKKGKVALSAAPQSSEEIKVKLPLMWKKGEYRIIFEGINTQPLPLLAKGSVVSTDEFLLKDSSKKKVYKDKGVVSMNENDSTIVLSSAKASIVYNKAEGAVVSYKVRGRDVVEDGFGIRPVFHRAPTDNDYGDGEPYRTLAWKRASQNPNARAEVRSTGDKGVLAIIYTLPDKCSMETVYTLYPGGVLHIASDFKGNSTPDRFNNYFHRRGAIELPRLGFRMRLGGEKFRYFGRGPVENYWDRKPGSLKGLWESKVTDEYFPYARPQETGHHTETAWINIGGLTAVADSLFEFSALHQRIEDLDGEECTARDYQWSNFDTPPVHDTLWAANRLRRQTHLNDVPVREDVELVIDYKMTGVGGYDSWGWMPEESQSLWTNGNYSWGFTLIPEKSLSVRKSTRFIY